jgi:hypothetical protein
MATIGDGRKQPISRFITYLLSQEANALKQDLVENFGAREAIISVHASTNNTIWTPTSLLAEE